MLGFRLQTMRWLIAPLALVLLALGGCQTVSRADRGGGAAEPEGQIIDRSAEIHVEAYAS